MKTDDSKQQNGHPNDILNGANGTPSICMVGIGGAGVKLVETLALLAPDLHGFHSLDTDTCSLSRCHQSKSIPLGESIPCGLGTGGDSALGRAAVETDREKLFRLFQQKELVFLLAGMGGGTGTGAAPVIAKLARKAGALVIALVAMPFDCEGSRRANQAVGGLRDLKKAADVALSFRNQDIIAHGGARMSPKNALDEANRHLCQGVLGICRMLSTQGMLNISLADLQNSVRGSHALGSVMHIEATGAKRVSHIIKQMSSHPQALDGQLLEKAETVLVHIHGGGCLTMAQVCKIMDSVNNQAGKANVMVGASSSGESDLLSVTLIVSECSAFFSKNNGDAEEGAAWGQPSLDDLNLLPSTVGDSSYHDISKGDTGGVRGPFAFVAPAPVVLPPDRWDSLVRDAAKKESSRTRRKKIVQGEFNLEFISKGRFENSEPTIHDGEDLDQPTYIRRGAVLN